eukprot:scaffold29799_cov70-Cyclotella_meneghiniana.AAC.12
MGHPGSYDLDAMVCTVTVTHLAWIVEWPGMCQSPPSMANKSHAHVDEKNLLTLTPKFHVVEQMLSASIELRKEAS